MKKIVLVTGGFDPLHSGHIEYFKAAKKLGDCLVVGINSDDWLIRKKGQPFMPHSERRSVIDSLEVVNYICDFADDDGTATNAILECLHAFPKDQIIFANGGDRTNDNIPEMSVNDPRVTFEFGVGGEDKKNSSSWILDKWKTQKTDRDWGYWRVLDDKGTVKTKELVINPGCSLSDQRHFKRSEHWYVLQGTIQIETELNSKRKTQTLDAHTTYIIGPEVWHKTTNIGDHPAHIIEIQYGEQCVEDDIERRDIL